MVTKNYNILNDCRGMYEEEIFETILESRGIKNVDGFLYPTEDNLLPLDSLLYIEDAAKRVQQAVENNERIAILWDTDTDGSSSGAIITRYLNHFTNEPVECFIDEGKRHGLKGEDLTKYKDFDLLIIVDSLDENANQYKELNEAGVDIIILDHHVIKENIPYDDYAILVSSQRHYGNPQLSGAGVVWKFCKYLDEKYRTNKHLEDDGTIKLTENIDYVFRKAKIQLELAGITQPIIGIKRRTVKEGSLYEND